MGFAPPSVSSLKAWERSGSRKAYTIDVATIGDILLGAQASGDTSKLEARSSGKYDSLASLQFAEAVDSWTLILARLVLINGGSLLNTLLEHRTELQQVR